MKGSPTQQSNGHFQDERRREKYEVQVTRLLENRPYLAERRYKGDTSACDVLLDLDGAMTMAALTNRQAEAIFYVFDRGCTQASAARHMNITQQAVRQLLLAACRKIAMIYWYWERDEADE
ncbi:sigma factor-like helix-turn-helix DNA-binding protein [Xylanibacillus composti]|uniref:RNA polymerase sigma-70 region 4 domain-containing protein n=1 Tax=Xylanibacillus composti TaxID=1572762 RepID=A0A8J4M489_9BACL|nr:sigma factor-like helix-turn-helix DNA-binding protein [Xylanibacillus composti]GIQ70912.1 hypothetical protein XYCOK13_37360 [Xylanibacillus composti]